MPCYHPLRAWRTASAAVVLGREVPDGKPLSLPCGGCLGCRTAAARGWALRNHLEFQEHPGRALFTTLTYDQDHCPPTLQKRDLQLWLKRLRRAHRARLRFFASGEYGEQTQRPHFHALLYGIGVADATKIEDAWGKGHVRTDIVTPERIAYTAGYTAKKIGWRLNRQERIDPETGEIFTWEPPFIQMSRRPGIGGTAREFVSSWRSYAVHNGTKLSVPRFLHKAWRDLATDDQLEDLLTERQNSAMGREPITHERLAAAEKIAAAQQREKAARRSL